MGPEQQNEEEARNDRRDGKGQIDERNEPLLAAKGELGQAPCGGDAEYRIQRDDDKGCDQRQPDGRQRVRLGQRREVDVRAPPERLCEDGREREQQDETDEAKRDGDEQSADERGFGRTAGAGRKLAGGSRREGGMVADGEAAMR